MSLNFNYKSSVAYDLSLFDERVESRSKILKLPKKRLYKKVIELKKISFRTKVIGLSAFFVLALGTVIFNQVQLTELTDKIRAQTEELNAKQSYYTQLEVKHNKNYSTETIEDYAKNNLNMNKVKDSDLEYITLHK